MRAAIRALRMLDAKRHIAVLGDMLELGSLSGQAHAQIGAFAAQEGVALLFACGPESARMAQAANEAGIAQCFYAADKNGCWKSCCARSSRVTPCFSKRAAACGSRS